MALYAIGDLHLCAQTPDKSMDVMGRVWVGHEEKFRANCAAALSNADTLVLCGDHSWGRKLADCMEDLAYIEALPGRKILLRGNHDMFWDAKKTERLNQQFEGRLHFLQNNYYTYEDYALVGTKSYTFEGPFYLDRHGRIRGWDEEAAARAEKLVEREYERLKISLSQPPATAARSSSCSCITRRQTSSKRKAASPVSQKNIMSNRSSTPTATAKPASMTASRAPSTASTTVSSPATTYAGTRKESSSPHCPAHAYPS